jgi:hypothetical protein
MSLSQWHITHVFKIERGVKQGCPLASYLFLIIGEILNIMISQAAIRGELQGINFQGV